MNILEIFIGLPHFQTGNIEDKLHEERINFLVSELSSKEKEKIETIAQIIKQNPHALNKMPSLPFSFTNSKQERIDFRLHNEELMSKLNPILSRILKEEAEGWLPKTKGLLISELREKHMDNKDIEKEVKMKLKEVYVSRVCDAIENNRAIKECGDGIKELLIGQFNPI